MVPPFCVNVPRVLRCVRRGAFTLIEMLVVVGIIGVLLTLVLPAVSHLLGAGNLSKAAYTIDDTLEKARAYAMANNTYVWVGFAEQNAASNASPAPAGVGIVTMVAVASKDGTSTYGTTPKALLSVNLVFLDAARRFDNVHLNTAQDVQTYNATLTAASGMYRAAVDQPFDEIGDPACVSMTPFSAPVNGVQTTFYKVIEFSPQGVVRVVVASNPSPRAVPNLVEIVMQPTNGSSVDQTVNNVAAIQVDGLTGVTRVYRP